MNVAKIFEFQRQLAVHNDREWFALHKSEWLDIQLELKTFTAQWLEAMREIDPDTADLRVQDCMYRIYRDTRFSSNKAPYKDWIGIIVAPHGGRKSPYGCYYLHFQPGNCLFAGGIWCPEPDLVKALRQDIFENYEELEELFARSDIAPFFTSFDLDGQQKKLPAGFPKDFPHPTWLARRSFTFEHRLTDAEMLSPDLFSHLLTLCRAAQPINRFLNYTLDNR